MMKGTTKIELTDIHTGEKQVIEKHNMVTNAMKEIFQPTFAHLSSEATLREYLPVYKTLMGGLLLFDDEITANVNQLYATKDVNMVGCAGYNLTNSDGSIYRGSYNLNESIYDSTNKKMTFVYDFTTAQANGTIASVCLSHVNSGYSPYLSDKFYSTYGAASCFTKPQVLLSGGKDRSTTIDIGSQYAHLFCLDVDNDVGYYFSFTDTTNITIVKKRLGLKNISLLSTGLKTIATYQCTALSTALKGYRCYNFDEKDNALYIFHAASTQTAINGNISVIKIAFNTWAVTEYTITNTGDDAFITDTYFALCHDGYCYFIGKTTPYSCYKIQLTNTANIVKLTGTMGSYQPRPIYANNGRVYWDEHRSNYSSDEGFTYMANSDSNKLEQCGHRHIYMFNYSGYYYIPSYTPIKGRPMFYYISNGTYYNSNYMPEIVFMTNYLATINNLTEPVEKTADKTMKITYVIQEV